MPKQARRLMILDLKPTGRINRRSMVTTIEDDQVLARENMMVIGSKKEGLYIKKMSGSSRYNSTSVGSNGITWADRYYAASNRKNFMFSNGVLYFIDENGNTSSLLSFFNQTAIPCSMSFRVSSSDIMYFSEGVSTGMYSHDGNIANTFQKEEAVTLNFVDLVQFLDRTFAFEEDSEDLYFSKNL